MAEPTYTLEVAPEQATDGSVVYVARHPELSGCMAHGSTAEEAVTNLDEARELYLKELERRGVRPPTPTGRVARVDWTYEAVPSSTGLALPVPSKELVTR